MLIGIPAEIKAEEYRVGLTPVGVKALTQAGHWVMVQSGAGAGSHFPNNDYVQAGAEIVRHPGDLYTRAALIVKIAAPMADEAALIREGHVVMSFLHLAPNPALGSLLSSTGAVFIGYETMEEKDRSLPVLSPMSGAAGRLAVITGANWLARNTGGRGVFIGSVVGAKRGRVAVVGSGTAGLTAARTALGLGSDVTMLDIDPRRLDHVDRLLGSAVTTLVSTPENLRDSLHHADLAVGAVLVPGARAPVVVTLDMIRNMKPGSVLVDLSIDQGGCLETSRPTSPSAPTFVKEGIVHCCVDNLPSLISRTASDALTAALVPYLLPVAESGIRKAAEENATVRNGINIAYGHFTHPASAAALGREYTEPLGLMP